MAKDKKKSNKADAPELERSAAKPKGKKDGKKQKKGKEGNGAAEHQHHPLEALSKLAEHPLVADLLAVGALAAVGAIAEAGKADPHAVKSAAAAKSAGKAAAAAIGARLLKEFTAAKKSASNLSVKKA